MLLLIQFSQLCFVKPPSGLKKYFTPLFAINISIICKNHTILPMYNCTTFTSMPVPGDQTRHLWHHIAPPFGGAPYY